MARVLLVDDDQDNAFTVALLLRRRGHEVICVSDGMIAVAQLPHFEPDCVVLDLMMPHLNGFQVARQIRQAGTTKTPRIIAVTGLPSKDLELGDFDGYLLKPFEMTALERLIGLGATDPSVHGEAAADLPVPGSLD